MHSQTHLRRLVESFDPTPSIDAAATPPASWYIDPELARLERSVFAGSWQYAGPAHLLQGPGDFVSGNTADEPWVVVRQNDGSLRAFFNVCRHHATCIVEGAGHTERLVCPYHGWSYGLDGALERAPKLGRVASFSRERFSLVPMEVAQWGPMLFVRARSGGRELSEEIAEVDGRISLGSLRFVKRHSYDLECNWKVFVDNYLDGGYHVAHLHRGLAGQLDLGSYETRVFARLSLQLCGESGAFEPVDDEGVEVPGRLEGGAVYAFVYPNFMLNRYGPILDVNHVSPLGPERCRTVFDYYFDEAVADDDEFVERSLVASDKVQQEDIDICEAVQRGLRSSAYDTGCYATTIELAAYDFHKTLFADLATALRSSSDEEASP